MKYNNITIILKLLSPWERELLDQYIRMSGIYNYKGNGVRDAVTDWFTNGGYQKSFEVIHHGDYVQALYNLNAQKEEL